VTAGRVAVGSHGMRAPVTCPAAMRRPAAIHESLNAANRPGAASSRRPVYCGRSATRWVTLADLASHATRVLDVDTGESCGETAAFGADAGIAHAIVRRPEWTATKSSQTRVPAATFRDEERSRSDMESPKRPAAKRDHSSRLGLSCQGRVPAKASFLVRYKRAPPTARVASGRTQNIKTSGPHPKSEPSLHATSA
jgi:hypothetical protein